MIDECVKLRREEEEEEGGGGGGEKRRRRRREGEHQKVKQPHKYVGNNKFAGHGNLHVREKYRNGNCPEGGRAERCKPRGVENQKFLKNLI